MRNRVILLLLAQVAWAADWATGQVIPDVNCAADASQSYALYLPSDYDTAHARPVIFASGLQSVMQGLAQNAFSAVSRSSS